MYEDDDEDSDSSKLGRAPAYLHPFAPSLNANHSEKFVERPEDANVGPSIPRSHEHDPYQGGVDRGNPATSTRAAEGILDEGEVKYGALGTHASGSNAREDFLGGGNSRRCCTEC